MNTETEGINNVLLVSLIISFVLHFALLQVESGLVGINEETLLPATAEEIRIPIGFVPSTQNVTVHQYSVSELEALQKLLDETLETESVSLSRMKTSSIYSLNRTKSAIHHYLLSIREEIEKNKQILASIGDSNLVGNVKIGFSISAGGLFSSVRILESSGDKRLDRSAMEAIDKASGKTKRPKNTGYKTIQTSAVIKYQYGL